MSEPDTFVKVLMKVTQLHNECVALQSQLLEARESNTDFKATNATYHAEVSRQIEQIVTLKAKLTASEEENATYHGEVTGHVEHIEMLKAEVARLQGENQKLRAALLDVFKMIDEGMLVRDITKDGDEFWAFEMLKLVSRLKQARAALKTEGDGK